MPHETPTRIGSHRIQQEGACLLELLVAVAILAVVYATSTLAANRTITPYTRAAQTSSLISALRYYREAAILNRSDIRLKFSLASQRITLLNKIEKTVLEFSPRLPLIEAHFGLNDGSTGILTFRADTSSSAGHIRIGSSSPCTILISRYGRLSKQCE